MCEERPNPYAETNDGVRKGHTPHQGADSALSWQEVRMMGREAATQSFGVHCFKCNLLAGEIERVSWPKVSYQEKKVMLLARKRKQKP